MADMSLRRQAAEMTSSNQINMSQSSTVSVWVLPNGSEWENHHVFSSLSISRQNQLSAFLTVKINWRKSNSRTRFLLSGPSCSDCAIIRSGATNWKIKMRVEWLNNRTVRSLFVWNEQGGETLGCSILKYRRWWRYNFPAGTKDRTKHSTIIVVVVVERIKESSCLISIRRKWNL